MKLNILPTMLALFEKTLRAGLNKTLIPAMFNLGLYLEIENKRKRELKKPMNHY